jgi:hypothetical protein
MNILLNLCSEKHPIFPSCLGTRRTVEQAPDDASIVHEILRRWTKQACHPKEGALHGIPYSPNLHSFSGARDGLVIELARRMRRDPVLGWRERDIAATASACTSGAIIILRCIDQLDDHPVARLLADIAEITLRDMLDESRELMPEFILDGNEGDLEEVRRYEHFREMCGGFEDGCSLATACAFACSPNEIVYDYAIGLCEAWLAASEANYWLIGNYHHNNTFSIAPGRDFQPPAPDLAEVSRNWTFAELGLFLTKDLRYCDAAKSVSDAMSQVFFDNNSTFPRYVLPVPNPSGVVFIPVGRRKGRLICPAREGEWPGSDQGPLPTNEPRRAIVAIAQFLNQV